MSASVTSSAAEALAPARSAVLWSDRPDAPARRPPIQDRAEADLVIIGGGFTGLWAALHATQEPGRRVMVVEAQRVGFGASSRNGGFCDASLTHGLHNGASHWPDELETLVRLGRQNHRELLDTLEREQIDAGVEEVPDLTVATEPWQVAELAEGLDLQHRHGEVVELLDADAARARVTSPTFLGGALRRNDLALVDPARLAWGLADVAERRGVIVHEASPVATVEPEGTSLRVSTASGSVRADRVVMATNAYPGPVRRPRRYVAPVYDYVLATEPLTTAQRAELGWAQRDGVSDAGNRFHYYRLTSDDRILWGGYDALYHYGNRVDPSLDQREATQLLLAEHFLATFPQLEGIRFTHRWGGAIATTSRFTATWGTAHGGRLAWAAGYTGLGVGASRFGARVALDLVDGQPTERTELAMVRAQPFPFPPEPLRWPAIQLTRRALARADRRDGRRGPWLSLLDRFGIGFDS
ncbi:MAG: NAD(P)/FAD-dependent oxidoreductase [Acidimicrobiales bacterium]